MAIRPAVQIGGTFQAPPNPNAAPQPNPNVGLGGRIASTTPPVPQAPGIACFNMTGPDGKSYLVIPMLDGKTTFHVEGPALDKARKQAQKLFDHSAKALDKKLDGASSCIVSKNGVRIIKAETSLGQNGQVEHHDVTTRLTMDEIKNQNTQLQPNDIAKLTSKITKVEREMREQQKAVNAEARNKRFALPPTTPMNLQASFPTPLETSTREALAHLTAVSVAGFTAQDMTPLLDMASKQKDRGAITPKWENSHIVHTALVSSTADVKTLAMPGHATMTNLTVNNGLMMVPVYNPDTKHTVGLLVNLQTNEICFYDPKGRPLNHPENKQALEITKALDRRLKKTPWYSQGTPPAVRDVIASIPASAAGTPPTLTIHQHGTDGSAAYVFNLFDKMATALITTPNQDTDRGIKSFFNQFTIGNILPTNINANADRTPAIQEFIKDEPSSMAMLKNWLTGIAGNLQQEFNASLSS